jgi:hypothetical protein
MSLSLVVMVDVVRSISHKFGTKFIDLNHPAITATRLAKLTRSIDGELLLSHLLLNRVFLKKSARHQVQIQTDLKHQTDESSSLEYKDDRYTDSG